MRKTRTFLTVIGAQFFLLIVLIISGQFRFHFHDSKVLQANRELVAELMLTDFAIWTEARYTRHPSQTDFFSAFQDFPGSFEHFPAGAIIAPPSFSRGEKP